MQPALQPRVVHVRLPAEQRQRLAPAHDRSQLAFRQRGVVDLASPRIGPGEAHELRARHRVHVGDVAVGHAAQLDAERRGQHQMRETLRVAHRHLGGDPAAEAGADQYRIAQAQCAREIEIEIGDVVHGAEPVGQRRFAKPRMMRRDDAEPRARAASSHGRRGCKPSPACRNSSGRPAPRSSISRVTPETLILPIFLASLRRIATDEYDTDPRAACNTASQHEGGCAQARRCNVRGWQTRERITLCCMQPCRWYAAQSRAMADPTASLRKAARRA